MKPCRHCKTDIQAAASRCQHCHGWQGRLPGSDDPRFIWPFLLVVTTCFLVAIALAEHYRRLRPDTGALEIRSSRLAPLESEGSAASLGVATSISGQVVNHSSVAWKTLT